MKVITTIDMKNLVKLLFLTILFLTPTYAINPNVGGNCSGGGGCDGGSEGGGENGGGEGSGTVVESFHWYQGIGLARIDRMESFIAADYTGFYEGRLNGASRRTFKDIYREQFNKSPISRIAINLNISALEISDDLLDPSSIVLQNSADYVRIDDAGHIRQVLTDNIFTDIQKLDTGGFHIKMWKVATVTLTKPSGSKFYDLPTSNPSKETIFFKPADSTNEKEICITEIERYGARGTHSTTKQFVQDSVADVVTVTLFDGEDLTGDVLEREVVTYSDRGAKKGDYTLVRERSRASTDKNGNIGTLQLVQRDLTQFIDLSESDEGGSLSNKLIAKSIKDYGGANLTTTYEYYLTGDNKGRLKSTTYPDGKWKYYEYTGKAGDSFAETTKYTPWKDATDRNASVIKKEVTSYTANDSATTVYVGNQVISKSETEKIP